MKKIVSFLLFAFIFAPAVWAQTDSLSAFKKEIFIQGKDTMPYRILYPDNYNPNKKYPLLFFLHGAGEKGNDNEKQLLHGGDWLLAENKQFPAIVIVPQCPAESYWAKVSRTETSGYFASVHFVFYNDGTPTLALQLLQGLVRQWVNAKEVNKKQVYIGGLSMGGMGTYEMLIRNPKTFAAAFVICGGANQIALKKNASHIPLWIFHGAADPIVSVQYAREIHTMLEAQGDKVRYTEYPGVGHNSWDNAFAEKELMPWLFSFKR